jgi:hypothetical protein
MLPESVAAVRRALRAASGVLHIARPEGARRHHGAVLAIMNAAHNAQAASVSCGDRGSGEGQAIDLRQLLVAERGHIERAHVLLDLLDP